jgi:hypothetical protein
VMQHFKSLKRKDLPGNAYIMITEESRRLKVKKCLNVRDRQGKKYQKNQHGSIHVLSASS